VGITQQNGAARGKKQHRFLGEEQISLQLFRFLSALMQAGMFDGSVEAFDVCESASGQFSKLAPGETHAGLAGRECREF
jgi:hypothetical protein